MASPAQDSGRLGKTANEAYNQPDAEDSKLLKQSFDNSTRVPKQGGNMSQSHRSKKSRVSVPPGSVIDSANRAAQLVFKYISENDYRQLDTMLGQEKGNIDVTKLKESRMYTALSFAAFKNHQQCFKTIYNHAIRYNIAGGEKILEEPISAVKHGEYTIQKRKQI